MFSSCKDAWLALRFKISTMDPYILGEISGTLRPIDPTCGSLDPRCQPQSEHQSRLQRPDQRLSEHLRAISKVVTHGGDVPTILELKCAKQISLHKRSRRYSHNHECTANYRRGDDVILLRMRMIQVGNLTWWRYHSRRRVRIQGCHSRIICFDSKSVQCEIPQTTWNRIRLNQSTGESQISTRLYTGHDRFVI